jgi:16S rRNA (guanine1207-N2)-methyltransferase
MPSTFLDLLAAARPRLRPPVLIALGAPRLAADLVTTLGLTDTTCYQMDLHQADRLRDELQTTGVDAAVEVKPDLWDLPAEFNTVLVPSPPRGDRELKRDVVEQAYHVLRPRGLLVVLSPVAKDQFYPAVMKKAFGKVALETSRTGTVLWSPRGADHPLRRHEVTFPVRISPDQSVTFTSRPGVFTYGHLDDGARALLQVAEVRPGDSILDLGCGTGTVGVLAGLRAGGPVTFVDSNVRAAALAEINARANGLTDYRVFADARLDDLSAEHFDLVLANPPYYAQQGISRLFVQTARRVLRQGGRLYVVTKQADVVGEMIAEQLGEPVVIPRRDYAVLMAVKK